MYLTYKDNHSRDSDIFVKYLALKRVNPLPTSVVCW